LQRLIVSGGWNQNTAHRQKCKNGKTSHIAPLVLRFANSRNRLARNREGYSKQAAKPRIEDKIEDGNSASR
jgi:hypothetical protein